MSLLEIVTDDRIILPFTRMRGMLFIESMVIGLIMLRLSFFRISPWRFPSKLS